MRQKSTANVKLFLMKVSKENIDKQKQLNWYMLQIYDANFVLQEVVVLVSANTFSGCGIYVIK